MELKFEWLLLLYQRGRVYLKERDCQPGSYKFDELCEVMRQSRKIIIVISNSFLKSEECLSLAAFAGEINNDYMKKYRKTI